MNGTPTNPMRAPARRAAHAARAARAALALVLATGAAAAPAAAQEGRDVPAEAPDRWKLGMDFSLTSSSGNESLTVIATGFNAKHLIEQDYELELDLRGRYGRSEGEEVARNTRGTLKFDFQPESEFSPFVFVTAERDKFKKLDLRANGGAGAKYRLWRDERGEAAVSLAALYNYEDFRLDPGIVGLPESQRNAKWSWRLNGRRAFTEGVSVEHATFWQPVWDDTGDYLIDSQTTARVILNERVALSFGYTFERDSTPLPDVRPNDHLVRAGVTLNW